MELAEKERWEQEREVGRGEEGEEPANEQIVKDRGIKQAKRWRRAQRFV